MVGMVVRVDQVRYLIAHSIFVGYIVNRALEVSANSGRRIEEDDTLAGSEKSGLVGPVRDPVEVALDASDVVSLAIQRWSKGGVRDGGVVRQRFDGPIQFWATATRSLRVAPGRHFAEDSG